MANAAAQISGTDRSRHELRSLKRKLQRAVLKATTVVMRLSSGGCE